MTDCDAVVIGSGSGGLTAALALARAGKTVQVFEQHSLPGGWMHSFGLGGYRFSPGVHYLGGLQPGGDLARVYSGLGMAEDLTFLELDPDGYDRVWVGDQRHRWVAGGERNRAHMAAAFPKEAAGVTAYLDELAAIGRSLAGAERIGGLRDAAGWLREGGPLLRWGLRPLEKLLHHHVQDPVARAVLSVQVGDTGLPPSRMPTVLHAAVMQHYAAGAWYPMGGGGSLARAYAKGLRAAGSKLNVNAPVDSILTEAAPGGGRRVAGVRLSSGQEIRSPVVLSNADPQVTFTRLLPPEVVGDRLLRKVGGLRWSLTALSLFFAARIDPEALGLSSGNLWWLAAPDVEACYRVGQDGPLDQLDTLPGLFLTVTSLKDRTKRKGDVHTLEAFWMVPYDPFAPWAGTKTRERPAAYLTLKDKLQALMLRTLERALPGIGAGIVFAELGTPLTNEFYCRSTRGGLYGTEKSLGQLGPLGFLGDTPIGGLHLCGASTLAHGVAGAAQTGLMAAARVLGCKVPELLDKDGPALTLLPAEQPGSWPSDLKAKADRAAGLRP